MSRSFMSGRRIAPGEIALRVDRIVTPAWPGKPNSFEVRAGEIVGIAGLVGAGRTELLRVLFGIDQPLSGSLAVHGKPIQLRSSIDAINAGLALVPEDRKGQGLILEWDVNQNGSLPSLKRDARGECFIDRRRQSQIAADMIRDLGIRTPSAKQIVQFLSGGNQQKVVLGKWLALDPSVLLLDEPTRGIDIGAKEEIYRLIDRLTSQGIAVVFVSSEMEEILGLSDRVLVMHEGQITGELLKDQLSEEAVMHYATGKSLAAVPAAS